MFLRIKDSSFLRKKRLYIKKTIFGKHQKKYQTFGLCQGYKIKKNMIHLRMLSNCVALQTTLSGTQIQERTNEHKAVRIHQQSGSTSAVIYKSSQKQPSLQVRLFSYSKITLSYLYSIKTWQTKHANYLKKIIIIHICYYETIPNLNE